MHAVLRMRSLKCAVVRPGKRNMSVLTAHLGHRNRHESENRPVTCVSRSFSSVFGSFLRKALSPPTTAS